MNFSVATWNINSVRLRLDLVLSYLEKNPVDILALQETKCLNEFFPVKVFLDKGYQYHAISGQKSYNGVAILSKFPIKKIESHSFCGKNDCRHLMGEIDIKDQSIFFHNFYVPAGGDEADISKNEKFAHKLDFLDQMADFLSSYKKRTILVGDFNIAPLEHDVWSHKQLLQTVSHTPIECQALGRVQNSGNFIDIVRQKWPEPEKIYSWWSYRARDWKSSNRGRRLDHIWTSDDLASKVQNILISTDLRSAEKPSDHVPICARFDL